MFIHKLYVYGMVSCLLVNIVSATDGATNDSNTNTTEIAKMTTPKLPASTVDCSILEETGNWNFDYKYPHEVIADLLCRCHNICEDPFVASHVKDALHHYRYHPLSTLNRKEFIPVVTVFSALFLFGVAGNVLTIVILSKWMNQAGQTYTFIMALCCSDLLVLCVCMPIKVIEHFRLGEVFNEVTCKLSYYLRDFTLTWSVLTLTIISIERYCGICRPTDVLYRCTLRLARRVIIGTVVLSLWLALPSPFVVKLYQPPGRYYTECLQQTEEEDYLILYFIFYQTVLFTVPCGIMLYAYVRTCRVLWRLNSQGVIQLQVEADRPTSEDDDKTDLYEHDSIQSRKRVLIVLMIVVTTFVVCWAPPQLIQLLCGLYVIKNSQARVRLAFDTMTYLSCAINPFLFIAMSPKMYQQVIAYLRRFKGRGSASLNTEEAVYKERGSAKDL